MLQQFRRKLEKLVLVVAKVFVERHGVVFVYFQSVCGRIFFFRAGKFVTVCFFFPATTKCLLASNTREIEAVLNAMTEEEAIGTDQRHRARDVRDMTTETRRASGTGTVDAAATKGANGTVTGSEGETGAGAGIENETGTGGRRGLQIGGIPEAESATGAVSTARSASLLIASEGASVTTSGNTAKENLSKGIVAKVAVPGQQARLKKLRRLIPMYLVTRLRNPGRKQKFRESRQPQQKMMHRRTTIKRR